MLSMPNGLKTRARAGSGLDNNFREEGTPMPYANNHSVRIHYQVEGEGSPLVLQHGFTSSLQNWYAYGYVAALRQNYQLILIDARGHGQSDKPYDPQAYALQNRVEDVLDLPVPMMDLAEESAEWEERLRAAAEQDAELAEQSRGHGSVFKTDAMVSRLFQIGPNLHRKNASQLRASFLVYLHTGGDGDIPTRASRRCGGSLPLGCA